MPARSHVIRRQFLEVELEGTESDGVALQRRLAALCQDWLMPALEAVFDRLVPDDEYWTIDRLEIDLGSLRPEAFERGFVDAVTHEVERYLRDQAPRPGRRSAATSPERNTAGDAIERRSEGQGLRDAFLFFLHTGVLPWWFRLPQGTTLEAAVRDSWRTESGAGLLLDFSAALAAAIASPAVRTRLARQFSPDFLYSLLATGAPECAAAARAVVAESGASGVADGGLARWIEQVWQTAFVMWAAGERPTAETLVVETARSGPPDAGWLRSLPPRFARLLRDESRGRAEPTGKAGPEMPGVRKSASAVPDARAGRDDQGPRIELNEGVYVSNAGIVLLHPFLPRFFEALGIAREGALLQPERALHLLHFLATGQRVAPEYDLLIAKLLCNVPPETPVGARVELTTAEEDEVSALLAAVIRHWDALGDTSPDALRNTFLVRPGKLSRRGGDDLLQMEALSFDVLLDRLPWTIGLIQLPWMARALWVEWLP